MMQPSKDIQRQIDRFNELKRRESAGKATIEGDGRRNYKISPEKIPSRSAM